MKKERSSIMDMMRANNIDVPYDLYDPPARAKKEPETKPTKSEKESVTKNE